MLEYHETILTQWTDQRFHQTRSRDCQVSITTRVYPRGERQKQPCEARDTIRGTHPHPRLREAVKGGIEEEWSDGVSYAPYGVAHFMTRD